MPQCSVYAGATQYDSPFSGLSIGYKPHLGQTPAYIQTQPPGGAFAPGHEHHWHSDCRGQPVGRCGYEELILGSDLGRTTTDFPSAPLRYGP
jgi:hypothetical protein